MCIEIEDTGEGMSEEKVAEMLRDIADASIETIKNKKHVGILNACLRLKMVTDHAVTFDIESEVTFKMILNVVHSIQNLRSKFNSFL